MSRLTMKIICLTLASSDDNYRVVISDRRKGFWTAKGHLNDVHEKDENVVAAGIMETHGAVDDGNNYDFFRTGLDSPGHIQDVCCERNPSNFQEFISSTNFHFVCLHFSFLQLLPN